MTTAAATHHGPDAAPAPEPSSSLASPLARLRQRPGDPNLLRGFGPLVAGIVLFLLMVLLAPTVAPERVVERPVGDTTTSTEVPTGRAGAPPVSSAP